MNRICGSIVGFRPEGWLGEIRFLIAMLLTAALCLGVPALRPRQGGAQEVAEPGLSAEDFESGQGIGGAHLERDQAEEQLISLLESAGIRENRRARPLAYRTHVIKNGDIIGELAVSYDLNEGTILSVNNIKNARLLQIGQVLRIPNQDGILAVIAKGETLETLAERYGSDAGAIMVANQLFSERVLPASTVFIPGGRLSWEERQEINGDLFIWPITGIISSNFGWRGDPFGTGRREFHSGMDIAALVGTPVRAAMAGRVSSTGFDPVLGNFVIITHARGYRTLYAHLSRIRTRQGEYVGSAQHIGDVGSTGRSTGPHLHFSVYSQGSLVNPRTVLR